MDAIILLGSLFCVSCIPIAAQNAPNTSNFIIDVNRPFAYIIFDHLGSGIPMNDKESSSRLFLKLVNNTTLPIDVIRVGGPTSTSTKDYRIEDRVVADHPGSFAETEQSIAENKICEIQMRSIPDGYGFEVGSPITVAPGKDILFSVPSNHLSRCWHMEIPFKFKLPVGNVPRPENVGGQPLMHIYYTWWDLPPNIQKSFGKEITPTSHKLQ